MLDHEDTIAALATAPGPAALALIRVSGRRAFSIVDQVFRGGAPVAQRAGHTIAVGRAVDAEGREIDQVLCAVFRAPRSYTGEDLAELTCHGGSAAPQALLAALLAAGARLAEPGEFTRRAYLGGKLDLAQAESVVDLIGAHTARARESALARLSGGLSREVAALRARTREALLECEAFLDFQDQLPDDFDWDARAREVAAIAAEVDALASTSGPGLRLREGARVALAGRPNVGKSSLLNALLKEERALVSELPGTTRDVLSETIDLGGVPVTLIDGAGLRDGSRDPLERAGIERARAAAASADALIAVVDVSEPDHPEDAALLRSLAARRGVVAANKIDLGERRGPGGAPDGWATVRTSARTGAGIAELAEAVRMVLLGDAARETVLVGTLRQERALRAAHQALAAAQARLAAHELLDTAAFEIREALAALDEAVGVGASEDVLNEIFRRFCIGK